MKINTMTVVGSGPVQNKHNSNSRAFPKLVTPTENVVALKKEKTQPFHGSVEVISSSSRHNKALQSYLNNQQSGEVALVASRIDTYV